ncbi:MAG: RAMP superfamily CRISPR-associated protein, partial [bacterium]
MGTVTPLRLAIQLAVQSDFHIGTGAGIGRVVDAAVRVDRYGRPVIPGATLKGLARDEARRLCEAYPALRASEAERRIFGEAGRMQGSVFFGNATPGPGWVPPRVHGRSARDRQTGRALDDHLFRFEDAATGIFHAEITSDEPLDEAAT